MKRFTIQIPEELVDAVGLIATRNNLSVVEMFRRYIKLGLLADKTPIYIKKDGKYVEVNVHHSDDYSRETDLNKGES